MFISDEGTDAQMGRVICTGPHGAIAIPKTQIPLYYPRVLPSLYFLHQTHLRISLPQLLQLYFYELKATQR